MCVHRTKDGLCGLYSGGGIVSYCVDGPCPDEVLTNADLLRSISDEELARFLSSVYSAGTNDGNMRDGFVWDVDWLRQPVEED